MHNSTIGKFKNNILDGVSNNKGNGRPSKWDSESTSNITLQLGGEKRIQMNSEEYSKLMLEEAQNTSDRSGTKTVVSNRDIKRFEGRNEVITDKNPEFTTDARDKACSNYRNCFATACAYQNQQNITPMGLQINFDATQSTVGDVGTAKVTGKRIGKIKGNKSKKIKKTSGTKGLVNYFVKSIPIFNADGIFGPMVHVHADSGMPKDQIDVYQVQGVGLSMQYDDVAYIVFCHDRSLCDAYEKW